INEVYYDVAKDKGAEGTNEWVEIYNPTAFEVDLKDWTISDATTTKRKINLEAIIKPGGYAVITKDSSTWSFWTVPDKMIKVGLGYNIGSGLNNDGDKVILRDAADVVIDQISYGSDKDIMELKDVAEGHSLERMPKGGNEFVDQPNPTLGIGLPTATELKLIEIGGNYVEISWDENLESDFENYIIFQSEDEIIWLETIKIDDPKKIAIKIDNLISGVKYYFKIRIENQEGGFWDSNIISALTKKIYSSAVIVNELLPHPSTGTDNEFIELFNSSNEDVDLSGWFLDDIEGGSSPYLILSGTIIKANSYLIFYKKETKIALNDDGDMARLFWPDNILVSTSEAYKSADYDISWSRNLDNSWLFSTTATPGAANIFTTKQDEIMSIPVILVEEAKKQEKNEWVKVEGVVTAVPGLFGKKVMYIQDSSGGIKIYFDKALWPELSIGDRVIIWGKISISSGEYQIKIYSPEDIRISGHDPPPTPAKKIIVELGNFVGQLVRVSGRVVKISGSTIWIDDGTGEVRLYFYPATGIKGLGLKKGDWVVVIGILSRTSAGLRLLPRAKSDLKIIKTQEHKNIKTTEIVGKITGAEKAQAAGVDYRNLDEPTMVEAKKEINILGIILILSGFLSLVILNIFAKLRKKYGNHNQI
ncbi:MAG: hypothetical protein CEN92_248, partial [Candidatus Berkelbacteria bacterium Licking1014_96]